MGAQIQMSEKQAEFTYAIAAIQRPCLYAPLENARTLRHPLQFSLASFRYSLDPAVLPCKELNKLYLRRRRELVVGKQAVVRTAPTSSCSTPMRLSRAVERPLLMF